ncbi:hypothetical protein Hypma_002048 [Hypsizygus marmoreus]|uniref:Uncharacterized protein n=1 Tax=Hypsizygus marmoreus TaxID=39966 RepID=A0A369J6J8_HYPMA|nr:hypothetical protein Hypma_002048 [Hypsizygus marmoreus]
MIHIDRNHHGSPLSPNSKQNNALIDHHKIISWTHDDSFTAVTNVQQNPAPTANANSNSTPNPKALSLPGPVTPVDPHDPTASHTSSPASPADGNTASPTRDRSSSLSPAPETGSAVGSSPSPAQEQEAPVEKALKQEEEEEDEGGGREGEQQGLDADDAVSPLSELSPPPPDEDDDARVKAEEGQASKPAENGKGGADVKPNSAESAKGGGVAKADSNPDHKASSNVTTAADKPSRMLPLFPSPPCSLSTRLFRPSNPPSLPQLPSPSIPARPPLHAIRPSDPFPLVFPLP